MFYNHLIKFVAHSQVFKQTKSQFLTYLLQYHVFMLVSVSEFGQLLFLRNQQYKQSANINREEKYEEALLQEKQHLNFLQDLGNSKFSLVKLLRKRHFQEEGNNAGYQETLCQQQFQNPKTLNTGLLSREKYFIVVFHKHFYHSCPGSFHIMESL